MNLTEFLTIGNIALALTAIAVALTLMLLYIVKRGEWHRGRP